MPESFFNSLSVLRNSNAGKNKTNYLKICDMHWFVVLLPKTSFFLSDVTLYGHKTSETHLGGFSIGVPPLPIPNREVKPNYVDGTATSMWESR